MTQQTAVSPHSAPVAKKHPIFFVKTVILVELAAVLLYLAAQPLAFYKDIYNRYVYGVYFPVAYHVIVLALMLLFEAVSTLYLFFRWYLESYAVSGNAIVHAHGLLLRRETHIPLTAIGSLEIAQSSFGRVWKYGTLTLRMRNGKNLYLRDLAEPHRFLEMIAEAKERVSQPAGKAFLPPDPWELLEERERENVEFKSTLRWDLRMQKISRSVEHAAMKTVAAFLNSDGGHLFIGVGDRGEVVGLAHDYGTLQRKDADGFENHFTQLFCGMVGPEFRQHVRLHFREQGGKDVCAVAVEPAHKPAYLRGENREEFCIRTGNTVTALTLHEAHDYIRSRWGE